MKYRYIISILLSWAFSCSNFISFAQYEKLAQRYSSEVADYASTYNRKINEASEKYNRLVDDAKKKYNRITTEASNKYNRLSDEAKVRYQNAINEADAIYERERRKKNVTYEQLQVAQNRLQESRSRAYDQYQTAMSRAYDDYQSVSSRAYDEYQTVSSRALDEYYRVSDRAREEYNKQYNQALQEYELGMSKIEDSGKVEKKSADVREAIKSGAGVRDEIKSAAAQAKAEAEQALEEVLRIIEEKSEYNQVDNRSAYIITSYGKDMITTYSKDYKNSPNFNRTVIQLTDRDGIEIGDPCRDVYLNTLHLTKQVPYWGVWRRTAFDESSNGCVNMEIDFYLASLTKTEISSVTLYVNRKPIAKYELDSFTLPAYKSDKDVRGLNTYFKIAEEEFHLENAFARFSTSSGKNFDVLIEFPSLWLNNIYNKKKEINASDSDSFFNLNYSDDAQPQPSNKAKKSSKSSEPQKTTPIDPFDF